MNGKQLDRIRGEFKAWTQRPSGRSVAEVRTRILARIDQAPRRSRWRLATATTLVAAGLTIAVLVVVTGVPSGGPWGERQNLQPPVSTVSAVSEQAAKPLLIYELRSGTKLYLALARHSQSAAESVDER
ncbi:MAG: hypothetical protein GY769_04625 [bacterium]|nr:hypothetical protein [bacterium]